MNQAEVLFHSDRLRRFIGNETKHRTETDEIFSEVMYSLFKNPIELESASTYTFMFHVAQKRLMDYYRRKKTAFNGMARLKMYYPVVISPDPAIEYEKLDTYRQVAKVMDILPERRRQIMYLIFVCGVEPNEAAEILGVCRGHIDAQRRIGILNLRKALKEVL